MGSPYHDDDTEHEHDPEPMWDLEDMGEEPFGPPFRRGIPLWVVVITVIIVLGLLILLAWPLVAELLDRGGDSGGFPTPGPV